MTSSSGAANFFPFRERTETDWKKPGSNVKIIPEMRLILSAIMEWKKDFGRGWMARFSPSRGDRSLVILSLALWSSLSVSAGYAQTNAPLSETALPAAIQELARRARNGQAKAQCDLGILYSDGNGVSQDYPTSVAWFRKAANQGDAKAQLRLGMSYLEGKGVDKDINEAIKWFYKAAGHDPGPPNNLEQAVPRGTIIKEIITLDGRTFKDATVERADPDGILITYNTGKGGFGMAKLKFGSLPGDVQKACGYDAQAEAAFLTQQLAMEEITYAEASKTLTERTAKASEIAATLSDIVSDYHKTHTYLTNATGTSIYVCGDMACDVWNMVFSRGINAKIVVGDVKEDITSVAQAKHAGVLAEISNGEWLALECTGGYVVRYDENKRYFFGCRFSTPKEYRDFEQLKRQYNDAIVKGRAAEDSYNNLAASYKNADMNGRMSIKDTIQQQAGVLNDRISDLKQLKAELEGFRLTEN